MTSLVRSKPLPLAQADRQVELAERGADVAPHVGHQRLQARVVRGQHLQPVHLGLDRGDGPLVRRQVLGLAGDDEAALAGFGVDDERQHAIEREEQLVAAQEVGRLFAKRSRVDDRQDRR